MQNIIRIPNRINLFVVLTLIVFLTPVATQITRNNYIKLIEDMAYMVMLLQSVYIMLFHNKIIIEKSRTMILFFLLIVIFSVVGVYYNGPALVILQFREFKYLLLLIIMIPYTNKEYFKHVWTVLKIIAATSIPVAVIQWIIYRDEGDRITGLLGYGGSGKLTLFVLIIFFTELGLRLQNNKPILGYYFLYLIPTALNETKVTFFLFPCMLFIILVITKRLKSLHSLYIILACVTILFIWGYLYNKTYSDSIFDVLSFNYLKDYLFATEWTGDAGRFAKIIYAFNIIKNGNFYFGYGLGSSYIGLTSGLKGYIFAKYYSPEMFGGTWPQLFLSLIDSGFIGTFLLIAIILVFFIRVIKKKDNSIEKFISINAFVIVLATIVYQNIFYTYQIMYILVLYTTLTLKQNFEIKEDIG